MTATALEAIEAVLAHCSLTDTLAPLPSSRVLYDEGAGAEALLTAAQRRFEQSLIRRRLQCDQQYVLRSLSLSALSSSLRRIGTEDVGAVASCLDEAAESVSKPHIAVAVDVARASPFIALVRGASTDCDNIRVANDSLSRLNIARCRERITSCVTAIDERTRDVGAAHTRLLDATAALDAAITSV